MWRKIILLGLAYSLVALIPAWVFGLRSIALLFPSVGIALGAVLIFGVRLWVGVLLGCLLLGLFNSALIDLWNWTIWLDVLINAIATLLTVLTGYWLMKYWVNINVRQLFKGEGNAVLLVCLIAPIICALGAGFIFSMYLIFDLAEASSSLEVAFMWWLGDLTGILTMTPAMLIFFSYRSRHKRKYRLKILVSLCIMIVFSFAVFAGIIDWENRSERVAFVRAGDIATALLRENLEAHEERQVSLGQLLRFAPDLSEEDWDGIVSEWMRRHPGSAGFAHAVFVERNERLSFEKEMHQKGFPAFSIQEPDPDGSMVPAREAADYLPYMHIAPLEGKQDFIGLNAYSGDVTHDIFLLERVLYGKTMLVASGVLPWVSDSLEQKGVLLFKPLDYEKFRKPMGITVSGIFVNDLVNAIIDEKLQTAINLCLTLPIPEGGIYRLYGEDGCENEEWERQKMNLPVYRPVLNFGGEQLEIRALPAAAFQDPYLYQLRQYAWQGSWQVYMLICLTILLLAFFFIFYTISIQGEKEINRESVHLVRRLRHNLNQREKFLELLQKISRLGCWEQSVEKFKGSEGLCRIFGIEPDTLSDWRQLLPSMSPLGRSHFMEVLLRLEKHDGKETFAVQLKNKEESENGKTYVSFYLESQVEEDDMRYIYGVAQDVTLEAQQDERIQFLTYHDPVTQLGNSLYWDEQASEAVANAEKDGTRVLSIFEIALDDMENLVRIFGIAGSRAIQREIAERIRKTVGNDSTVIWRYSGFSCCVPDSKSVSEVVTVVKELLKIIKLTPLMFEQQEIVLSLNIGIAMFPENGRTLDNLQRNAMTALRVSKAIGLDNFQFFEPDMNHG